DELADRDAIGTRLRLSLGTVARAELAKQLVHAQAARSLGGDRCSRSLDVHGKTVACGLYAPEPCKTRAACRRAPATALASGPRANNSATPRAAGGRSTTSACARSSRRAASVA